MDGHYSRQIPHIIEKVIFSPWLITAGGFQAVQMLIVSKLAKEASSGYSSNSTVVNPELMVWTATNTGTGIGSTNLIPVAMSQDFEGAFVPYTVDSEGIAAIPVSGVLGQRLSGIEKMCGGTDYLDIQRATQDAIDKRAKGVLYAFDSSGGMVRGCADLADYIKGLSVPTQAYTDSRCNSAAYWLASACNGIMSSASADVGSIGVILPWIDKTKVWEVEGLSYDPFINEGADLKGAGAGPTLTTAQKHYLQETVNYVGEKFQSFVSGQRKVKPVVFRAGTYFGEQALDVGLIDKVGTYADAYDTLLTRVKNKNGNRAPVPKTIQVTKMTKEELQAQHPELYATLVQENETTARAALDAARTQERTRLSELDALALTPECKAIVDAAKTDGRTAQAIGIEIAKLLAKDNEHLKMQVGVYKGAKPAANVAGIDPLSLDDQGSEKQLTSRLSAHFAKRMGTRNGRSN